MPIAKQQKLKQNFKSHKSKQEDYPSQIRFIILFNLLKQQWISANHSILVCTRLTGV